jgi:ABC-2 type transport system ATP-binding protein
VINHGRLVYDGGLSGLAERFGRTKLIRVEFAEGEAPADLERFGEVARRNGPEADIKVDRGRVGDVLGALLDAHAVADISVQDPPLEQVIARVFQESRGDDGAQAPVAAGLDAEAV